MPLWQLSVEMPQLKCLKRVLWSQNMASHAQYAWSAGAICWSDLSAEARKPHENRLKTAYHWFDTEVRY